MSEQSRLDQLNPNVRAKVARVLASVRESQPNYDWTVAETYRDAERQNNLYQIGRRGIPGEATVTNARGGTGMHQQRRAADIYPITGGGIPNYEDAQEAYDAYGEAAGTEDMTWGGTPGWGGPEGDYSHIQYLRALAMKNASRERAMLQQRLSNSSSAGNEAGNLGSQSEGNVS